MYPLAASVRALYEAEQRQVLRITYNGVETVSGGSVSVSNAIAGNAQGLSVAIAPVQRGSGNPSSTNIRPFIGVQSVAVGVSGKNICPAPVMGVSYNNNTGAQTTGSSTNASTEKFPVNFAENATYTLSKSVNLTVYLYAWDAGGNYIGRSTSANFDGSMAITPSIIDSTGTGGTGDIEHIAYMAVRLYQGTGQSISDYANAQLQLEIGSTATTYAAYAGSVSTVALGRTVYGGSLNFLTGALSVEWGFISSYNGETLPGEWLSDRDVYAADTAPTTGAQVAYRLSTPDSYTLSGAAVALAGGTNNMFVSAGDMTVSYNAVCTITDADIMEGGFEIDRYSCNGNKLEYGTAIAAELTLKLDNRQGKFDNIIFEGVEMFVEIGIADWTQTNPTINWMPCGYFTPDKQPRTLNTITINALDRMTRFDTTKPLPIAWTDGNGTVITDGRGNDIEFKAELRFPATVEGLVRQICRRCGVDLVQSISSLPNASLVINELPQLQQEITYRNLIQWCAGIMGTNAWIDWNGNLCFSRYNNSTQYVMTTANRFSSDLYENDITFTGVSYTNVQGATLVVGTSDYTLDFTGNYLIQENVTQILTALNNVLNGFTYRPFNATVKNAPYLWPMDTVTFTDKNGVAHSTLITNVNFGLNGTTVLEGRGETTETNTVMAPSAMTAQQGFIVEKAIEKTLDNVDKSMTQEAIFNRLTNYGQTQALILYEGNLYLNATYINTGTLIADIIKGGILTLGGSDNLNGVLHILDANGAIIGGWDKNGITINNGIISLTVPLSAQKTANLTIQATEHPLVYTLYHGIGDYTDIVDLSPDGLTFTDDLEEEYNTIIEKAGVTCKSDIGSSRILLSNPSNNAYTKIGICNIEINDGTDLLLALEPTPPYNYRFRFTEKCFVVTQGNLTVQGSFSCLGTKSRKVPTDQYSERLLYCYETPTPMFGDIGEGAIADDGKCFIWLDPVFAQTITTDQYQVFLQKYGSGDCWVAERKSGYFVVEGTPGLAFGWEIKAKQLGFDQRRLDNANAPFSVPYQDYGETAAQHIQDIMKERDIS